jgi:flagellar biosynthetic protein FliQ
MTEQGVIDLAVKTVWVAIKVASPALLATLVTGLVVSIFQAATQVNEQTLTFIPKIIVMTVALALLGPWIMQTMLTFTTEMFTGIAAVTH